MNAPEMLLLPDTQSLPVTRAYAIPEGRRQGPALSGRAAHRDRRRAAHGGRVHDVGRPAARRQGHAHVAVRRSAGGLRTRRSTSAGLRTLRTARCWRGCPPSRATSRSRFRTSSARRAGVRRGEPARLPGGLVDRGCDADRRTRLTRDADGAGDEPVPVLEEDLRLRRAQPALAHHDHRRRGVGELALEELARVAEEEASCEVYGLLKRPDEKWVTERAYDNPKFVEDLVRDIALRMKRDPRVGRFTVDQRELRIHPQPFRVCRDRGRRRGALRLTATHARRRTTAASTLITAQRFHPCASRS